MSEETLLTASRRVVRFFKIDERHGGFTTTETVQAVETLRKQIELTERKTSDERLLKAARRMEVRFGIDEANGGLLSIDTLKAVEALDKHVHRVASAQTMETGA